MASIFTYQEEPPRVHSPWSTPGNLTPKANGAISQIRYTADGEEVTSVTKLEPERQDGPTEYKLHLLLRRRKGPLTSTGSTADTTTKQQLTDSTNTKTLQQQPHNSRQTRLQQLTTQLLWRLQQSSPFHSSSNADLVLPVLPEATPRLGVPERPATLLPGLEESQGALYEIGVADDGTLVGLVEEELEESLNNLRAMAASLGCVVDILRRVLIAQYDRKIGAGGDLGQDSRPIKILVAEVLVRPETKSPKMLPLEGIDHTNSLQDLNIDGQETRGELRKSRQQLRVAVTGPSTAGKSSLVGTLTTSKLDNGRGKSRLSLLKHRHEVASGVTSSVAQELLGYRDTHHARQTVVNYSTGDVSSWPDIHNLASRLVFLSDSPGLARYAKSTFRTLISWRPDWTLVCIVADDLDVTSSSDSNLQSARTSEAQQQITAVGELADTSLVHLNLCLRLGLPIVVVITKMDIATKTGLKCVLSRILSALKNAGRTPCLLGSASNTISLQDENVDISSELALITDREDMEIKTLLDRMSEACNTNLVPIVLTSAVTGAGIGKVHTLLRELAPNIDSEISNHLRDQAKDPLFHVDEIFSIPPSKVYSEHKADHSADRGIVLCGHLATGRLAIGDQLRLGPFLLEADFDQGEENGIMLKSASCSAEDGRRPMPRALSGLLSKSLQNEHRRGSHTPVDAGSTFLDVTVVSLRSLRLPVRSMETGETGTVGVQPLSYPSRVPLSRARKGMVLSSSSINQSCGYRSFAALFPAADFTNPASPTLILGGHAIAYINSIRAAVKVTALVLEEDEVSNAHSFEPSSPAEFFSFDGDDNDEIDNHRGPMNGSGIRHRESQARIVFRFVSSTEWMEIGSQVLVVPTLTAAGPVTGPIPVYNGLMGFVGVVCGTFA